MRIDKLLNIDFQFDVVNDDGEVTKARVFVPQPAEAVMSDMVWFLKHIYSQYKKGLEADIIVTDYKELIKEANGNYEGALNNLERILTGSNFFINGKFIDYNNAKEMEEANIGEDEIENIKGSLVFIYALYRYISKGAKIAFMKPFNTSASITEWKTLHRKPLQGQSSLTKKKSRLTIEQ